MKDQSLRVLMVDDSEDDVLLVVRHLQIGGYNPVYQWVDESAGMKKALQEKQWDIILCDYQMPRFDVSSAIALLNEFNKDIPLIIVSGNTEENAIVKCLHLGAKDYVVKDSLHRLDSVINRELAAAENRKKRKQAGSTHPPTMDNLKNAVGSTILAMASAAEARYPYTSGHQHRTAELVCSIGEEMELSREMMDGLRIAAYIHDVGNLYIPLNILTKPDKLTSSEFSIVKEHAKHGYEMLKNVESCCPLAKIVYQHHERMNGSGYPENLRGDEILMEARILAVSDVVESMSSQRPHRPSLGIHAALEEIEGNKNVLYDGIVADTCLKLFREKGYRLN